MRELLEQAAELIDDFTDRADLDRMPMVPHEAYRVATDLRKLVKTAELRDKAWAAMKEADAARTEWDRYRADQREPGSDVFERLGAANLQLERLCRKVAETET